MAQSGGGKAPTAIDQDDARSQLRPLVAAELDRLATETQNLWGVVTSFVAAGVVSAGALLSFDAETEPWRWGLVATVPVVLFGYGVMQACKSVILSYYRRSVERWLYDTSATLRERLPVGEVPASPLWEHFSAAFESNRRGLPQVRIILYSVYSALMILVGSSAAVALSHMDGWLLAGFFGLYVFLGGTATSLAYGTIVRGRRTWIRVREGVEEGLKPSSGPSPEPQRRLISYLLLPRPADFIVKTLMLHGAATLLGWWMLRPSGPFGPALLRGGLVLLCFEYFIYQARYMLNDRRGKASDDVHPVASRRKRLPHLDTSVRQGAFAAAFWIRMIAGLGLPFLFPTVLSWRRAAALGGLSIGVFALAGVYEFLRSRPHDAGSPVSAYGIVPLAIYTTVGLSYGTRATMGLWFGSNYKAGSLLLVGAFVTYYLYGVCIVLMTWVLEGARYLVAPAPGSRSHAYHNALTKKPHLLPLTWTAGLVEHGAAGRVLTNKELRADEPILEGQGNLGLPWNLLAILSLAGAGVLGFGVRRGLPFVVDRWSAVVLLAALGLGVLLVKEPAAGLTAVTAAAAVTAALLWEGTRQRTLLIGVPAIGVAGVYASTRAMTYEKIVGLADVLQEIPKKAAAQAEVVLAELFR